MAQGTEGVGLAGAGQPEGQHVDAALDEAAPGPFVVLHIFCMRLLSLGFSPVGVMHQLEHPGAELLEGLALFQEHAHRLQDP